MTPTRLADARLPPPPPSKAAPPRDALDSCEYSQSTAPTSQHTPSEQGSSLDGCQISLASNYSGSVSKQLLAEPSAKAPVMSRDNLVSSMKWGVDRKGESNGMRNRMRKEVRDIGHKSNSGWKEEKEEMPAEERRSTLKASNGNQRYNSLHAFLFSEDYDMVDNRNDPSRDLGSVATASISQMTMSGASAYAATENDEQGVNFTAQFDSPKRRKKKDKAKRSPKSVIPDEAPSGPASPTRHRKIWKSQTSPLDHRDAGAAESEAIADNDDGTYETIVDNYSEVTGRRGFADGIRRALFVTRLDKIHDFITGNACWSSGVEKVKEGCVMNGCVDEEVPPADAEKEAMEDYLYVAKEDSLVGGDNLGDEDTALTPGLSIETSLFSKSMDLSEFTDANRMKKSVAQRRGRSRTARHGYNSDRSSVSASSRGSSVSVSSFDRELAAMMIPPSAASDISIASESVAESILSQDQDAWLAMTQQSPSSAVIYPMDEMEGSAGTLLGSGGAVEGHVKGTAPSAMPEESDHPVRSTALMSRALERRKTPRTKRGHA